MTYANLQIYFPFSQNKEKYERLDPCDERNKNMDMDIDEDMTQKGRKMTAGQLTTPKIQKHLKNTKKMLQLNVSRFVENVI